MEPEFCSLPALPVEPFDGTLDWFALLIRKNDEALDNLAEARVRLIALLRGERDVAKFVRSFDQRKKTDSPTLDEVADKAKISSSLVVGAIARVLYQRNYEVSKLAITAVCAKNAPQVADTMVRAALDPQTGNKDRRLFMETVQAVKSPGVNVNAQANATVVEADKAVVFTGTMAPLPPFEDGTKRRWERLRQIQASDGV